MPGAILPTRRGPSAFLYQDREGAPARSGIRYHGALDWFAAGGTEVRSPVHGVVVERRESGGDRSGQVFGGTLKIEDEGGRVYAMRHVEPTVPLGTIVEPGDPVGRVTEWADAPGSSHVHLEVWRSLAGGYRLENMIDPGALEWSDWDHPPEDERPELPGDRTLRLALPGGREFAGWDEVAGPLKWIAAHGLKSNAVALAWQGRVYRGAEDVRNVAVNLTRRFL